MQTIYTITDLTSNDDTVTGTIEDIWPTIEGWYDLSAIAYTTEEGTDVTVGDTLDLLAMTLNTCGYTGGYEESLQLNVEVGAEGLTEQKYSDV
jgi:hypothetical protein